MSRMKGEVDPARAEELAAQLARLARMEAADKVYQECLAAAAARIVPLPCAQHGTDRR